MERIKLPGKVVLDSRQIILLQSKSNYTEVFSAKQKMRSTIAMSLCHVTGKLDDKQFLRINRNTVVNTSFIVSIENHTLFLIITLKSGLKLKSSRRRTEQVKRALEKIKQDI